MDSGRQKTKPPLAYGILTPVYDSANNIMGFGRSLLRRVVTLVDAKEGERVLDLACGTGTLLDELLTCQPRVSASGLDPDGPALAIARAKIRAAGRELPLVQGVGERLPFADSTFDVVISTMAFHHLSTPTKRQTAAEVHRVLKGGGQFVLADFGRPNGLLAALLLHLGSLFDGRENLRANLRGEIPWILAECGFSVDEVAPPYRGVRFLRANKRKPSHRAQSPERSKDDRQKAPTCCGSILTSS